MEPFFGRLINTLLNTNDVTQRKIYRDCMGNIRKLTFLLTMLSYWGEAIHWIVFDWVRLVRKSNSHKFGRSISRSIAELNRTQSTDWVRLSSIEFDFRTFDLLCRVIVMISLASSGTFAVSPSVLGILVAFVNLTPEKLAMWSWKPNLRKLNI